MTDLDQIRPRQAECIQKCGKHWTRDADGPFARDGGGVARHLHVAPRTDQKDRIRSRRKFRVVLNELEVSFADELDRKNFRILPEAVAPLHPLVRTGEIDPQRPDLLRRRVIVEKMVHRVFPDIDSAQPGDGVVDEDPALFLHGS